MSTRRRVISRWSDLAPDVAGEISSRGDARVKAWLEGHMCFGEMAQLGRLFATVRRYAIAGSQLNLDDPEVAGLVDMVDQLAATRVKAVSEGA